MNNKAELFELLYLPLRDISQKTVKTSIYISISFNVNTISFSEQILFIKKPVREHNAFHLAVTVSHFSPKSARHFQRICSGMVFCKQEQRISNCVYYIFGFCYCILPTVCRLWSQTWALTIKHKQFYTQRAFLFNERIMKTSKINIQWGFEQIAIIYRLSEKSEKLTHFGNKWR